jgi:hypothetical protein|tara:strand:- start:1095 stop:1358 length:264 start_codon:yes stop_codon:yes gene_type:complete
MKKAIWTISIYFDDEKTKLMFEKEYKNVNEIITEFKLSKYFLYDCCLEKTFKRNTRKRNVLNKYKRIKIQKKLFTKSGDFKLSTFSV